MPTQLQNVRRSSRNAGKKIKTPKYAHDLFEDPPKVSGKKKHGKVSKKTVAKKKEIDENFVPEEEEEEDKLLVEEEVRESVGGSHPSKNYSKIALYDRWVKSRNDATDYKNELETVQKQLRKLKKEYNTLTKELDGKSAQVQNLQDKLEKEIENKDGGSEKKIRTMRSSLPTLPSSRT